MATWRITFPDHAGLVTRDVVAEYYQRDEGFATFKDQAGKVVFDVKLNDLSTIEKVNDAERTIKVKIEADTTKYIKAMMVNASNGRMKSVSGGMCQHQR